MFFLRQLRTSAALRRASSKDGGVLAAVRAELAHELSSPSAPSSYPASFRSEDAPDFATVSDAAEAQDVLLLRRRGTGSDSEEVVLVSALLAPLRFGADGEPLPRAALMKVLVTKPGGATSTTTRPVLRFDCRTAPVGVGEEEEQDGGGSDSAAAGYAVTAVRYHSSPGATAGEEEEDEYQGPEFRQLDPRLQAALREYLVARGVSSNLATSILRHLLHKERAQYVNWLKVLEQRFSKDVDV